MNRIGIVQACLDRSTRKTYLEIGVERGLCFARIRAGTKIAVDPHLRIPRWRRRLSERRAAASHYVPLESDEFFRRHATALCPAGIDVVFIDGLHTWEQALRDVDHSLVFLAAGGVIVLHDCNPRNRVIGEPAPSYQAFRKAHPWRIRWSGDVWKAIAMLRSTRRDLDVVVLDCDYGVGLVRRGRPRAVLDATIDDIRAMEYEDLCRERTRLLNLRPPARLHEFLRRGSPPIPAGE